MNESEMTYNEKVHDVRKKIDSIIQYVELIMDDVRPEYYHGKREAALAHTKLQEAKMWAGKILEQLGDELPKEFQDKANG